MEKPLDLSPVRTHPISERAHKVHVQDFGRPLPAGASVRRLLDSLPDFLAAKDLLRLAAQIAQAYRAGHMVILAMGAHPIKVGLGPLLVDLLRRGLIRHLGLNGAASIHDVEVALFGATSEDVSDGIQRACFGFARETGEFCNTAARQAADSGHGLGQALGEALLQARAPHASVSPLAVAREVGIPATVHVTIGADITHMHPGADGAAIGAASHLDFRLLAASVARLGPGGVLLNVGSAELLPMLIEKSVALARNLGHPVGGFLGVNMDMIQHYRSDLWPVERACELGGEGIRLTGHHEIMLPLLAAAVLEYLEAQPPRLAHPHRASLGEPPASE